MKESKNNLAAHKWYHVYKLNVIPFDSASREPILSSYKQYQYSRIPLVIFNDWLEKGLFERGMAIIPGKIYSDSNEELYWVSIDLDSQMAIKQLCAIFGPKVTLKQLSEKYLVEIHKGTPGKAHVSFLSPISFPKKNSDTKIGLEVKSKGGHRIMIVSPSPHRDGTFYEILGTEQPITLSLHEATKMIDAIVEICKKYGLSYGEKSRIRPSHDEILIGSMIRRLKILDNCNYKIEEGSRNNTLFHISRLILNYHYDGKDVKKLGKLKQFFDDINDNFSSPNPLSSEERDNIWNSSLNYLSIKSKTNSSDDNNQAESPRSINRKYLIEYATEEILEKHNFITIEETKEIYYYVNGVYVKGGDIVIEKEIEENYRYLIYSRTVSEVKGHIMRKTYHKRQELDTDLDIINLRNGLYSVSKNELKPHNPDYLSIIQKPIVFNSNTKPKLFGKFLKEILYVEEIRMAIEIMAYTFYRDCPFEYFFKLFGYGANGKSVFTGLLTVLHGRENVSNVSIKSLLENRFAISDLESKDVNIDNELTYTSIKDTSTLKKLTGGRKQPIRIERKNQHAYDTYIYAKMFFNANSLNDVIEKTIADYRREVIISFPNTFEGKNDDPHLLYKLSTEEEMSGIFNVLMKALGRILQKNELYLNEKTIDERRKKSDLASNPVKSFIDEAVSEESVESDYITKTDLYYAYVQFCKKNKIAAKTIELFGKNIKKLNFPESKITIEKQRKRVWLGINIKPQYSLPIKQLQLDFNQEKMSKVSRVS